MCYDISYLTKRQTDYARRYGTEEDWQDISNRLPAVYHVMGFQHPEVPVVYRPTGDMGLFSWGLIPFWAKSLKDAKDIRNKTINARGETVFDKPSFRQSAANKRCLVVVDGFFESHHFEGKTYPFFISRKDREPFALGGLYEEWTDRESGEVYNTFTIVTTAANERMEIIHNSPSVLKRGGPRMPFIVPYGEEGKWLDENLEKDEVLEMIRPFDAELLADHPVPPIRGKNSVGNRPEAIKKKSYPELEQQQKSLF